MVGFLLKLFVKDYKNTKDNSVRENYGTFAGIFGIICNLFLCALKVSIGIITKSISIMADGLNNLTDMGSSVVTMIGFRLSNKPADPEHPFGHGRMEYLSAFIVSCIILLLGGELFTSSIKALINGDAMPVYSNTAIIILVVSVFVKLYMFFFNKKLSRLVDSSALSATAQDCINDAIATFVILLSVVISKTVALSFNLDAVMGIAVALFILYSGFNAAKETIGQLLGEPPAKELLEEIESILLSFSDFKDIHDLIVHNYGPGRMFASVHIEVDQNIDIVHCHEQVDLCEKLIEEKTGVVITIHMDPVNTSDEEVESIKKEVLCAVKNIDERLTIHDFRTTPKGTQRTNLIFDAVMPSSLKISKTELEQRIGEEVAKIDPTYVCVVTIDTDFTGRT